MLVKIEEKRGYFTITYFKAKTRTEYKKNKRVLGYFSIQKDEITGIQDFVRKIKHFYIENLSNQELILIR